MFETLTRAASTIWSGVKYVAAPIGAAVKYVAAPVLSYVAAPIVITARAVSSAGQTVFSIRKFVQYITGSPTHIAMLPLVGVGVLVNLLTFFPTRAPLLWRFFRISANKVPPQNQPHPILMEAENEPSSSLSTNTVEDADHEEIIVNILPKIADEIASSPPPKVIHDAERGEITIKIPPKIAEELRPLGKTGKFLYLLGLIFAWSSTFFIGLNSYLFNVSFMNFVLKLMGDNLFDALKTESEDDPEWEDSIKIGVQALSFLFVLASVLGNITFNQLKNKESARKFAEHVENRDLPLDRYTAGALAIGGPAVLSAFFVGMFSTESALAKLPYIVLSDLAKTIISGYSAFTAFTYSAMTSLPAVRKALMREKNDLRVEPACWEKPLVITVGVTGLADTAITSASIFTSFAKTMANVSGTDPHHIAIIASGGLVSLSALANNYQFSVHSAMKYVLDLYHEDKLLLLRDSADSADYQRIPQTDIEETETETEQPTEAIAIGASRFGLFPGGNSSMPARSPVRSLDDDPRAILAMGGSY